MENTSTGFLQFAYLIEISVVFNLAFLELKLKKNFEELQLKTKEFGKTADGLVDVNICKERICCSCEDKEALLKKFRKENIEYLKEKTDGLFSNENGQKQKENIRDAWTMSGSKWRWILSVFQRKVALNGYDRRVTIAILGIVTFTLCVITLVDSNIFVFHSGLGFSVNTWNAVLYSLLVFSIVMPVLFWQLWRKLLSEFECLSILHVKARDAKTEETIKKDPKKKLLKTIQDLIDKIDASPKD